MNVALVILDDDLPLDYLARQTHSTHASFFQSLTVIGVVVLVAAIVFAWVALVHKPRRRRKRRNHRGDGAVPAAQAEKKPAPVESSRRHKHRRREHRPRNPTLAETHGLPPTRDEEAGSQLN